MSIYSNIIVKKWEKALDNGEKNLGTSDLSLRMHYSRRTGFILVVMI